MRLEVLLALGGVLLLVPLFWWLFKSGTPPAERGRQQDAEQRLADAYSMSAERLAAQRRQRLSTQITEDRLVSGRPMSPQQVQPQREIRGDLLTQPSALGIVSPLSEELPYPVERRQLHLDMELLNVPEYRPLPEVNMDLISDVSCDCDTSGGDCGDSRDGSSE